MRLLGAAGAQQHFGVAGTRFHAGEEKNDPAFADALARIGQISPDEFDRNPMLLNVANGTIDDAEGAGAVGDVISTTRLPIVVGS